MPSLIVCEKPKVAEKVASALAGGAVQRKQIHGISYYEVERGGKKLIIAPAVGHIYSLRQTEGRSGYPVFDIEWAPAYEIEKGAKFTKSYVLALNSLAKNADECINACDFDIEGSLIGYNAIRYSPCGLKNAKRMKFSALTSEDLVEAYENLMPIDENNAIAGEARHILDWFWGINLSRALMSAIKSAGTFKVLSIGRVQGPALHILAHREREISAFKPQPYWQLFADSRGVNFGHEVEKFFKREEAEAHLLASEAGRHGASVEKVERTLKKLPPNPPFDLTSLQVEAFRCFGVSPAATLSLAQALYEASLISYPRTSSQKLPAKLNFPKILSKLSANPAYAESAKKLISSSRFKPHEGAKSDPAHPAIHPTGQAPNGIGEREMKLYDLIVKRFLACFAPHATREGMRVDILLGAEKYHANGARTAEKGWIAFYEPYAKFEEVSLPDFKEKEPLKIEKIEMPQKETQPPKRYTEASIIQALEKHNLGTKATRAVVIETLHKRGYIKGKKSLEASQFGLRVDETLSKHCKEILDEKLTREFEAKMDLIADGKETEDDIVHEAEAVLEVMLAKFKKSEKMIGGELAGTFKEQRAEEQNLGKCAKCGENIRILRSRKSGKQFAGCSGYPKCTQTYPLPQYALIMPTPKVCEKCGTPIYGVRRKGRRDFEMCLDPNCPTKANWGKPKESRTVVIDSKTGKPIPDPVKPAAEGASPAVHVKKPAPASTAKKPASAKRKTPAKKKPAKKEALVNAEATATKETPAPQENPKAPDSAGV